ncbi:MFS transporter [Microlunatus parietis]|uniref:MFS family permease n=1 Tax=Microlunatus parietis TaxID=682979 RepID=A0A7Y9IDR7_9ACTN|nr:MFS transporter [Microlunatus parietis]NYE74389.1 MFS family permease [Microlunatus parietis]
MSAVPLGPVYARLWSATALSNLGDGIRAAAFPLLAASLTSSPVLVTGVAVAGQLPGLLFGLLAGVVADRVNRRVLVLVMDIVRTALLIGLVAMIATGHATIWAVYVVVFASGLASVLRDTSAGTLLPSIVGKDQLDRANGRMVTAEIAGNEFVGPPLGAYLFGVAIALPFAVNGGTMAIAAALVASIPALVQSRSTVGAGTPVSNVIMDLRTGLGWLIKRREVLAVPATSVALAMTDSAWFTLLVLYLREVVGLPDLWFGIMLAVGAVGGLAGGLVAARIGRAVGLRWTIVGSLLVAAAGQLALGVTSRVAVTAIVLATSSAVFAVWNVAARTLIQRRTPLELLGRVSSINGTVITAASILGALLGGVVAQQFGLHLPFLLGVPLLLAAASIGWWALRPRL